jgi:hypothetical protein
MHVRCYNIARKPHECRDYKLRRENDPGTEASMKKELFYLLLAMLCAPFRADADTTHGSFQDFAEGTPGAGGSNIYVTQEGTVQIINQFDFDQDGFLDIYLLEDHNVIENVDAFVYLGAKSGPRSILPTFPKDQPLFNLLSEYEKRLEGIVRLPSDGGGRSLLVDLNKDGFDDLVFCNYIHNYGVKTNVLIYWNGPEGFDALNRTALPSLMGNGIAVADFNQDSFPDLAVTNGGIEMAHRWGVHLNKATYVYWNGPKGFSAERKSELPCNSPVACSAGDFDGDGHPDLAIANNDVNEKSVYVYWGGSEGLRRNRVSKRTGGDPIGLESADLDGDGDTDWIILHKTKAELSDISGRDLAFNWRRELATGEASECFVADLNRDGNTDIAFASTGSNAFSLVYFGDSDAIFDAPPLQLPTRHAADVDGADFNNDGWTDLIFANQDDGKTTDIESYIYWNGPEGFDPFDRRKLQAFGPVSVSSGDVDHDGHADAVLINRYSGVKGATDLGKIFWGNARHRYGPDARVTRLDAGQTATGASADINQDGRVDIATGAGNFYHGNAEGGAFKKSDKLDLSNDRGGQFADLNRDGYLDFVTVWGIASLIEEKSRTAAIYWGAEDGFTDNNRRLLTTQLHVPCMSPIADLNNDGHLDLVLTDMDTPYIEIFWGAPRGNYTRDNMQRLRCSQALGAEIADLDADGWLDLVLGGGWDYENMGLPTENLTIVWGDPHGYVSSRLSELEAFNANELCVADLNKDGNLDIITSNYHGDDTRSIPAFIYWGQGGRSYSEQNRSSLPAESSSHVAAADYNMDSWIDVLVSNHIEDGRHTAGTYLYWGGAEGYSHTRRHWFQSFGVHLGMARDLGNIFTRQRREEYVSAPVEWATDKQPVKLLWRGHEPAGATLNFQFRSGPSKNSLKRAEWTGPSGPGSDYKSTGTTLSIPAEHTHGQYRAIFRSETGAVWPTLAKVTIVQEKD